MIRLLELTDIPAALELGASAGWNQIDRDWRRFITHDPDGCFAAIKDGRLVATVTSTTYDRSLAWIGMMLVHSDYRGQGIAKRLMLCCLDHLRSKSIDCVKLDATPMGLPVYQSIGFRVESEFNRWELQRPEQGSSLETNKAASETTIDTELDRQAFGVNRQCWLELLAKDSVVEQEAEGYAMIRVGRRCDYLGPVIASDTDQAAHLIENALARSHRNVFWDVPPLNHHAVGLAKRFGFEPVRDLSRMRLGRSIALDMTLQFAMSDPGTG